MAQKIIISKKKLHRSQKQVGEAMTSGCEEYDRGSKFVAFLIAVSCIFLGWITGMEFKHTGFCVFIGTIAGFVIGYKTNGGKGIAGASIACLVLLPIVLFVEMRKEDIRIMKYYKYGEGRKYIEWEKDKEQRGEPLY